MLQFNLPNSFFFYIVTPIIGFNYGYPKPRYKNDRFIYLSLWSLHATRSLVEFQKLNSRRTDKHILPKTRRQTRANGVVSSACSCRLWSTGRLSFVTYEPSTITFFLNFISSLVTVLVWSPLWMEWIALKALLICTSFNFNHLLFQR